MLTSGADLGCLLTAWQIIFAMQQMNEDLDKCSLKLLFIYIFFKWINEKAGNTNVCS